MVVETLPLWSTRASKINTKFLVATLKYFLKGLEGMCPRLTRDRWSTHCVSPSAARLCFTPAFGLTTRIEKETTETQSEEEYLDTWTCFFFLSVPLQFTSQPSLASRYRWICHDEGQTDEEKNKILCQSRHRHHHHYRSGQQWKLVSGPGFQGKWCEYYS